MFLDKEFAQSFADMIALIPELEVKLLASLVALVFLWLVHRLMTFIVNHRHFESMHSRYQARKTVGYVMAILGMLLLGRIWVDGFQSLLTAVGLISAGLVIALKDMMIDLAGWMFIIWRQPFKVGDRIQIGEFSGDVIDIRMFQFTILEIGNWVDADQSTGRLIHIPNGKIFQEAQANYNQGFQYIWDEIPVILTFDSNWPRAKNILHTIATKHTGHLSDSARKKVQQAAERYFIFYSRLTPIVYTSVKDYGIVLTIRYLSEPRRRRSNEEAIWEDILREFALYADISFAYPTQRFYNHALEGPNRPYQDAVPETARPPNPKELGH
jgi:small-conductance mechanosensitive channel